jgi:hypothetical protein
MPAREFKCPHASILGGNWTEQRNGNGTLFPEPASESCLPLVQPGSGRTEGRHWAGNWNGNWSWRKNPISLVSLEWESDPPPVQCSLEIPPLTHSNAGRDEDSVAGQSCGARMLVSGQPKNATVGETTLSRGFHQAEPASQDARSGEQDPTRSVDSPRLHKPRIVGRNPETNIQRLLELSSDLAQQNPVSRTRIGSTVGRNSYRSDLGIDQPKVRRANTCPLECAGSSPQSGWIIRWRTGLWRTPG